MEYVSYYMHTFRLKGTAFLIKYLSVINVNQQKILNVYLEKEFNLYLYQKNKNVFQFFQIQYLIQISHKLH